MSRNKMLSLLATSIMIVSLITATYAYFQNTVGNTATANIDIITERTTNLC